MTELAFLLALTLGLAAATTWAVRDELRRRRWRRFEAELARMGLSAGDLQEAFARVALFMDRAFAQVAEAVEMFTQAFAQALPTVQQWHEGMVEIHRQIGARRAREPEIDTWGRWA